MKHVMKYRRALPFLIVVVIGCCVTVSCIDVGHDAELGCLADSSEPGCQSTGGFRATGGKSSGPSSGGNSEGGAPPAVAGGGGMGGTFGSAGEGGLGGFGGGNER